MRDVVHAPAVHGKGLGRDETRLGRNQEGHRVGDIFRKTGPPDHGSGGHRIDGYLSLSGAAAADRDVGRNEAGCNCVDGNAVQAQFQGEAARQRNDGSLGGGVKGGAGERGAVRGNRGQVDDATEAPQFHAVRNSARHVNEAVHVGAAHRFHLRVIEVRQVTLGNHSETTYSGEFSDSDKEITVNVDVACITGVEEWINPSIEIDIQAIYKLQE